MLDKFHATLRHHGRSVTTSRTLLFEYLQAHEAISLKQFVADNRILADQASLYRSLQLFRELGIIEERFAASEKLIELSDSYDTHHHHLTCMNCGKIIAIHEDPALEQWITRLAEQENFTAATHQLEIRGHCQKCQLQ